MTVDEAAAWLTERVGSVHPRSVYGAVKAGKLAHHRICGSIRITESDLEEYLASVRVPARKNDVRLVGGPQG